MPSDSGNSSATNLCGNIGMKMGEAMVACLDDIHTSLYLKISMFSGQTNQALDL